MKSALECNPHSNVIRNFWEKKKRNPRIVFELIRYIKLSFFASHVNIAIRISDTLESIGNIQSWIIDTTLDVFLTLVFLLKLSLFAMFVIRP